ncbi:sterile alpha motif domain-containing protein 9-like [Acipenser ruthenus]|uniref:sterile alpha motif domain-containing protein 9-like n=1 Tax=Acipenser ruthenus TaxID=7906 RepID=UPI00274119A9|nr:sterile alpha motif domain-containing protein 9-like [Acipenser ruthenus]
MEFKDLPLKKWTENHVKSWLESVGLKDQYIQKLYEDEVTGPVLMVITEDFLKAKTGMKPGQIELLLSKRNELLKSLQQHETQSNEQPVLQKKEAKESSAENKKQQTEKKNQEVSVVKEPDPAKEESSTEKTKTGSESSCKRDCNPRPFDTEDIDFKYVKHTVLQPESGIIDRITPCHEYKSFATAAQLDRQKLQAKFANEVLRFACGCMNVRTNGTIHFGVMDSVENTKHVHGEIIGVPVNDRDFYVDALDYIERCFKTPSEKEEARLCIRMPKFIEVIHRDSQLKHWVIEVDIVPTVKTVRGKIYSVCLPNFNEKSNKVQYDKIIAYRRVGAKTELISEEDKVAFILGMPERDSRREEAESTRHQNPSVNSEDLGRKLSLLLTCGKKRIDNSLKYILVTNKWEADSLECISFLLNMNIFCVFDFDPDSKSSGLCSQYEEHHAVNLHFLQDYTNESGQSTSEFIKHLHLFDQTSWIFCNGRSDYLGDENSCDEMTWIKTKKKHLRKAIIMLCNEILPKGSFVVIFLLMSPVEQPLIHTFHEFYVEMNGNDYIVSISESMENYNKWASQAQASCSLETLNCASIVGMKMSHVDETVQSIQPIKTRTTKHLRVFNKGLCSLKSVEEERKFSLEILSVDQCDDIKSVDEDFVKNTERYFYQGGKVSWEHFWLADNTHCGEIILRDAYRDVAKILDDILKWNPPKKSVERINIYHHPGSGGSTVARQLLWNFRGDLRCAVVKPSYPVTTVCEHAVQLREYEEKDRNNCLPVLLLVEDCDEEYIGDLRHELGNAIASMKINPSTLCFILLSCKRSHDPEKMYRALPLQTVAVTHKLTEREKKLFAQKRRNLEQQYEPQFILTFVLMSEEFKEQYIKDFVEHLLQGIDHSSLVTRLIRYVALLNCYVQNSYIPVSHCEAFLGLGVQNDRARQHHFESQLSEQARLVFVHLRENPAYISSIRIIHPLVAKEILQQLSSDQQQSAIAMDLLHEQVLFEHRFGRDYFMKFIRNLFIRRYKRSKGDNTDSFFSPLIEHVCNEEENPAKAMDLLKVAYTSFGKDPFFAQQLARLHYTHEKFEEAKHWAEVAKSHLPHDSFILHTEGQVYKKWFNVKYDLLGKEEATAENTAEIIGIALKATECFRASEKAAKSEEDLVNDSAYFGEIDVGCRLLQLISSVNVFSNESGHSELLQYLLTDHIPEEVKKPWHKLHSRLKGLQKSLCEALEWISEDLSYFQTDKSEEEEEQQNSKEQEHIYNPRKWLLRKTTVYARFFSGTSFSSDTHELELVNPEDLTPLMRRMRIYQLGGGNITTILSLLTDHKTKRSGEKLEQIINIYPEDLQKEKLDPIDLVNYIFCQIALGCALPRSQKLVTLQKLQELSLQLYKERNNRSPTSAFFLHSLLFWPDESQDMEPSQHKNKILMSAISTLKDLYEIKIKNVPPRKKRIFTHFYLGQGKGLDRFIHRSKLEKFLNGTLNERRLKWLSGEVWATPEITQLLKRVKGWTENGSVFVRGTSKGSKIRVLPLHSASVHDTNENVTFYLGFSFYGPVALHIEVLH